MDLRLAPVSSDALTVTGRARKGAASVVVVALLVGGCGSVTVSPSPSAMSAPVPTAISSTGTPAPSTSAGPSNAASGADGTIVFYRTDDARSMNTPFSIDPDGSHETQNALDLPSGIWSPGGGRLLISQPVPDRSPKPGAETAWVRPAVVNPDGSGFRLLNAYPDRKIQLVPLAWATDGSRIFVQSGDEDVDLADMGLYTVRSSDGGDLSRIMVTDRKSVV